MRILIAIAVAAGVFTSEAVASSIIRIEDGPATASPSALIIQQKAPMSSVAVLEADQIAGISRSVLTIGQSPAVSGENVAAINGNAVPKVLRGGAFGEALPAPVVEPEPVKELSRPAQRAKERAERRAIREAIRFGEPLPEKAETDANQPATDQESGT